MGGFGRSGSSDREAWRRDAALRRAARGEPEPQKRPAGEDSKPEARSAGTPAAPARDAAATPTRPARSSYRGTDGEPVVPPHPSRVDLHTHSCRSDGVLEPGDLIQAAAAAGVQVLGLADHDTVAGARELLAPGQPHPPLELLPGVEINSVARGIPDLWEGELHILGLGVDVADEYFESVLARQRELRSARFDRIVDRLAQLGYPIAAQVDALLAGQGSKAGASLGRPQIARCLIEAGFAGSVDEAMTRLLGRGKPAYVPREGLGPMEAISAIRAGGGLPVLAHFADAPQRRGLIAELMRCGLGGLEVHYRHFDAQTIADLAALATELRLIPTGGSDYHGDRETYAEAHASLYVPDEDAMTLYSALGRRGLSIQTGA